MILDGLSCNFQFVHSPGFFGLAHTLQAKNCNITAVVKVTDTGFGQSFALSNYQYIGDGVLRIPISMANDVQQHAVPNREYIVGFFSGGQMYDVDQNNQQTRFCVFDVSQDASFAYIKTSLTGIPSGHYFVGNPANATNRWYPAPYIPAGFMDGGGNTGNALDQPQFVGVNASSNCPTPTAPTPAMMGMGGTVNTADQFAADVVPYIA
jgi:hypothetical protein